MELLLLKAQNNSEGTIGRQLCGPRTTRSERGCGKPSEHMAKKAYAWWSRHFEKQERPLGQAPNH